MSARIARSPTGPPAPHRVLGPHRPWNTGFAELWEQRHLTGHLGWGYVRKRYVGTWLGLLWIPLRPGLDLLLRALVFGGFLQVSSGDRPYIIYLGVGMAVWTFFDEAGLWGYRALQLHRRYFRQVEVPWATAVAGAVVPGMVEAALYGLITLIAALYYELTQGSPYLFLSADTLLVPGGFALLAMYAWTLGLLFAPLVARIRDLRYLLRYLLGGLFFLTPVLYPLAEVPEELRPIIELNPLTAPVVWVQQGILGTGGPPQSSIVVSLATLAIAFPVALALFIRQERAVHARL